MRRYALYDILYRGLKQMVLIFSEQLKTVCQEEH